MDQAALVAQFPAATADAPPPPAANASPSAAVPPPSHPSYAEMITAAIVWGSSQGKEGGSSRRAIAKYIDRVYTNLPPSHSALLTHHLKRLKNSGHLVMIKNSYQLSSAMPIPPPPPPPPRSAPAAAPPPLAVSPAPPPALAASPAPANPSSKRGPGRPPKQKPDADTATHPTPISSSVVVDNGSGFGSESGKKRRGRPPKQPQQQGDVAAEVPFVQPISEIPPKLVNGEATSVGQKTRGRPPKQQQAPVVPFAQPVVQVSEEVVVADVPKRRPGRPPKANVVGPETPAGNVAGSEMSTGGVTMARSRGRPRKNALGPVSRTVGKKPRGRPRKLGGAVGMRMGMVPGKRRGRPPKGVGGGGPPKMMRRTGRRVGRPRKDASALRNQTSVREGIANEELMTKFQLIQSKIREAVAVIRPCLGNENAALMALQELEELATVNLTATSTEEAPPLPTTVLQRMNCPPTPAVPLNVVAPGSSPQPTATETAPFTGAPMSFDVTVPPMNVSAPFDAPTGMESEHPNPMSWFLSNEAES